jgi:endothelin-converting enzyme/putative endopeptidase
MPFVRLLLASLLVLASPGSRAQAADGPLERLPYSPSLALDSLDRSADVCTDFYQFSCGGWQQRNPIPGDEASWSVFGKLAQDNQRFLWGLLQTAAIERPDRTPSERRIGDYFAACMRPDGADEGGALAPTLAAVERLRSTADIAPTLAAMQRAGVDNVLFRFGSDQDFGDSSRVIATVDAGGLGMPDRDYYLKRDAKSRAVRAAYTAYATQVFGLLGDAPEAAAAEARTVLGLETALARASLTRVARREPRNLYHRMGAPGLGRLAPSFDWNRYLDAAGVARTTAINVAEPAFVRRLGVLLGSSPVARWQTYLRWHAARSYSPYLGTAFARAHFDFYSRTLRGVQTPPPRWRQCVEWVDRDLGDALGEVFVAKTFSADTKARAAEMAQRIERVMEERLRTLDWMSPPTRAAALAKLHTMVNKIGYPDRWRDYAALEIRRDDFFGNVQRGLGFELRRQLAKIGRPVDRDEWSMTSPTVNAYYNPQMNDINFPAGVLQPPLFDPRLDDAPNYGNTGSTIGHELTHAFDDEGRHFDAAGNLREWWTKKDAAEFVRRSNCVVDQYSQYGVVDDVKINGRLTLGEDLADLGGTVLAYLAWKEATAEQRLEAIDGFTPDQRFFIGMAQWACSNDRPEVLRLRAQTDPHSPTRYRINGVVANMPEFARAFSCKPGQPMARREPCRVW